MNFAWAVSPANTYCSLTYSIDESVNALPTFVTTSYSAPTYSLSILTNDRTKVGPHSITVKATLNTYPVRTRDRTFTLNVIDSCMTATITTTTAPSSIFYVNADPALNTQLPSFTSSPLTCGPFTYSISSPSPLPAFATFFSSTNIITVQ